MKRDSGSSDRDRWHVESGMSKRGRRYQGGRKGRKEDDGGGKEIEKAWKHAKGRWGMERRNETRQLRRRRRRNGRTESQREGLARKEIV